MTQELLYLRPDVQAEPLFDSWYAWPQLIPPATAARQITDRHLKIMDSYIAAPQFHARAIKDPKMSGGPFIDYAGKRVDEIKALRERTKRDREPLIQLSVALAELDACLKANANGYSLEPLYQTVPEILKGYVELVYDLNHYPSFRIIEPLLYKSPYYAPSAQSLMLSLTQGDHRSFVLSTPRLEEANGLNWQIAFNHERVDKLFQLEKTPQSWMTIKDLTGVEPDKTELLRSFFTTAAPKPYEPYSGQGARWRYFGHACVMIEIGGTTLLFDPVISYTYANTIPRFTYQDLPDQIDHVLLTHNHQDHVLFETLIRLRHKIKNIIIPKNSGGSLQDPSLKLILRNIGFKHIVELDEMDTLQLEACSITGLPFLGEHSDLNIQSKMAHLVRAGQQTLLLAADSCNLEPRLYEHIRREVGSVDTLFLGMECDGAPLSWLYGPLLTRKIERGMDQSRRLNGSNFEQAMNIVKCLRCKEAYIYAMGQEPWLSHVMGLKYTEESRPIVESNKLIQACKDNGVYAERLFGQKEVVFD